MLTASEDSTVLIFMILSIGIHGITILITMIHSFTHHGTIHPGHMPGTGDGDIVGTLPITAGAGATHPITVTGTDLTIQVIMDGVIHIPDGMVMAAGGMLTQKITAMEREQKVIPLYIMVMAVPEEAQHQ